MLKKLLILPLVGCLMSITAFASADTIDDVVSCFSYGEGFGQAFCGGDSSYSYYPAGSSNQTPSCLVDLGYSSSCVDTFLTKVFDNNVCSRSGTTLSTISSNINLLSCDSSSSDTPDTPTDDDNSSIIPEIPNSFTSGLTSLVNNFGGIIVNWLPTIILLSLGIYAIFALFRVVRNYAKSSFNG